MNEKREFYHDLITQKSFRVLQGLKRKFSFILIGGWAVFLYTKALNSKDIDIIVDYDQLERLKEEYNVVKNERLKKYEAKAEEIDIDIYLPFYSNIGLPAEEVKSHTQSIEGFAVPIPEMLLVLKIYVFTQRKGSTKGAKDLIDIFSILKEKVIDWQKYQKLIVEYRLVDLSQELKNLVSSQRAIPELSLSNHQIAKLKKGILQKLS